jgi:hypothetical protein
VLDQGNRLGPVHEMVKRFLPIVLCDRLPGALQRFRADDLIQLVN